MEDPDYIDDHIDPVTNLERQYGHRPYNFPSVVFVQRAGKGFKIYPYPLDDNKTSKTTKTAKTKRGQVLGKYKLVEVLGTGEAQPPDDPDQSKPDLADRESAHREYDDHQPGPTHSEGD